MSPAFLVLIVVLAGGAAASVAWLIASSGNRSRQRLAAVGVVEGGGAGAPGAAKPATRTDAVPALTQALQTTALWNDLQLHLIRAGWILRPSEFIAICAAAAIVGVGAGLLLTGSLAQSIVLACIAPAVPYAMLSSRRQRRLKMLTTQVPDALDMLASSLRSGCALLRAMQVVRSQMHPPIAEEFGRVVDEVQFGLTVEQAMDNLVARTGSYDIELIVTAVQTQLTVGGNLAEIFDSIAEMIRERVRLLGELQTASAEGRMSAGILLAMPFAMGFMINLISPGYLAPLFQETLGLLLLGIGGGLMVIGALIMRKMIDIDL